MIVQNLKRNVHKLHEETSGLTGKWSTLCICYCYFHSTMMHALYFFHFIILVLAVTLTSKVSALITDQLIKAALKKVILAQF